MISLTARSASRASSGPSPPPLVCVSMARDDTQVCGERQPTADAGSRRPHNSINRDERQHARAGGAGCPKLRMDRNGELMLEFFLQISHLMIGGKACESAASPGRGVVVH
jgi:hypothetical protein